MLFRSRISRRPHQLRRRPRHGRQSAVYWRAKFDPFEPHRRRSRRQRHRARSTTLVVDTKQLVPRREVRSGWSFPICDQSCAFDRKLSFEDRRSSPWAHFSDIGHCRALGISRVAIKLWTRKIQTVNPHRRQQSHSLQLVAAHHPCESDCRWVHR